MLGNLLRNVGIAHVVLAVLVAVIAAAPPRARVYGDRLQIALPLLAWGCATLNRSGTELFARFGVMFVAAHGTKAALAGTEINARPNGRDSGFPSAHTAAAAFGTSSLVHDCIGGAPVARALVVMAGAYVGASRIEADQHDIWQVLAGGLLGWWADRALRADSALRRRIGDGLRRLRAQAAAGLAALRSGGRIPVRRATTAALAAVLSFAAVTLARAETELSVYGGIQDAPASTIDHSRLGRERVDWQGRSFDMPPYYGFRATWWRPDDLGFGVEFNHAKVYAPNPAALGYARLEMTDGLNLLTATAWKRWTGDSRIVPYVGAGLGVAVPHVEIRPAGGTDSFGYQLTGPAVQLVAGAAYRIDDHWLVFGEVKGTWSRHRIDLAGPDRLTTEIVTQAVNLGFSYRF